jgi:predicted dithiol-disulfide oxidoreductase (DUF899 family)
MLWAVSRTPLAKSLAYRHRIGWTFPWASIFGGEFNEDFNVSLTERQQREGDVDYHYRPVQPLTLRGEEGYVADIAAMTGTDAATFTRERPGMSDALR